MCPSYVSLVQLWGFCGQITTNRAVKQSSVGADSPKTDYGARFPKVVYDNDPSLDAGRQPDNIAESRTFHAIDYYGPRFPKRVYDKAPRSDAGRIPDNIAESRTLHAVDDYGARFPKRVYDKALSSNAGRPPDNIAESRTLYAIDHVRIRG